jgi:glycosyltransferase involved in cell wall biosynthesis
MNNNPLVSVIIASYNHKKYVGKALQSILDQSFGDLEILIGDDASPDNSVEVIKTYARKDKRIKFTAFKENQAVHIRNYMIDRAKGKYIAILNSDDEFLPGKLEKQVKALEDDLSLGAVFTRVRFEDESGKRSGEYSDFKDLYTKLGTGRPNRLQWMRHMIDNGTTFVISSVMCRRDLLLKVGKFNELLRLASDQYLWMSLLAEKEVLLLPEELIRIRMLPGTRNLSAYTPENINRAFFETSKVLDILLREDVLASLGKIFPEIRLKGKDTTLPAVRQYLLCNFLLNSINPVHQFFALEHLYYLLSDKDTRLLLEKFSGKDPVREFRQAAGKLRLIEAKKENLQVRIGSRVENFYYDPAGQEVEIAFRVAASAGPDSIHLKLMSGLGSVYFNSLRVVSSKDNIIVKELDRSNFHKKIGLSPGAALITTKGKVAVAVIGEGAEISLPNFGRGTNKDCIWSIRFRAFREVPRVKFNNAVRTLLLNKFPALG